MSTARRPILWPTLGLMLLVGAVSVLVLRTTRAGQWQWDFGIYSAASRAWAAGENPYDEPALHERWLRETADLGSADAGAGTTDISWLQSIVPPTTLLILAPFATLPRPAAFATWYAFNVLALAAAAAAALAMTPLSLRQLRAWMLLAAIALLGPVHSGIHAGQPAIAAAACIVVAIWCTSRDRFIAAGVLLAIAAALKLQLAAPFIMLALYRRQWRTAAVASVLFALIAIAAIGRLQFAGVEWWGEWMANIERSASNGGPNDFTTANPSRDHLLNLQLPLYAITGSRPMATGLSLLLCATVVAIYAVRLRDADETTRVDALLLVAPAAVLTLLPVYHRYYDATLLIIPLAWAMAALARREAWMTLALIAPFILPVGWATNLVKRGYVAASVAEQSWWRIFVMPLQVWLLVALAIVLIAAIRRRRPELT